MAIRLGKIRVPSLAPVKGRLHGGASWLEILCILTYRIHDDEHSYRGKSPPVTVLSTFRVVNI